MIRKQTEKDLTAIMQIWLETNTKAHSFIPEEYWLSNYEMVKSGLPKAEVFVYEDDATKEIYGFIGLMENYIAGLFVRADAGKGNRKAADYICEESEGKADLGGISEKYASGSVLL